MSSQHKPIKLKLDNAASAHFVLTSLEEGSPLAKDILASMSPEWSIVAQAAHKGDAQLDRAFKAAIRRTEDSGVGLEMRLVFDRAKTEPRPAPHPEAIATIPMSSAMPCLMTRPLSEFEMEPTEYLCEPYLPRGYLILLGSNGGEGKSLLSLKIAADLSRGRPCLGSAAAVDGPVHSILIAAEDKVSDGIKPRFVAAGGDVEYLHVEEGVKDGEHIRPFDLTYVPAIQIAIEGHRREGRNIKFIIIDPINNYMGRVDTHKDSDLKIALRALTDLASEMDVTILCLTHLNKSGKGATANQRIMGGAGFVNTARLVYQLWKDPEDPSRRVFVCTKFNMPDKPPPLSISVAVIPPEEAEALLAPHTAKLPEEKRRKLARQLRRLTIQILPDDITAEELMNAEQQPGTRGPKPTATIARATWLLEFLQGRGAPVAVSAICDAAGEAGHLKPRPDSAEKKKWVSLRPIYEAKDYIPNLTAPHDGHIVEEIREGVRSFWRLAKVTNGEDFDAPLF